MIYAVQRQKRTRVQWHMLLQEAFHLEDVAKNESSSSRRFVRSFPPAEPPGWFCRYVYTPTAGPHPPPPHHHSPPSKPR